MLKNKVYNHKNLLPRWYSLQAKVSDDGRTIELEIESESKEDGQEEKKKIEYTVPKWLVPATGSLQEKFAFIFWYLLAVAGMLVYPCCLVIFCAF